MTISYNNADLVLTTSAATVAGVGFNSTALITKCTATNTDAFSHTVKLYRVINGGTASASNQIGGNLDYPIPAGGTITIPLAGHSLVNSQSLQALADTNSVVNLSVSYTQIDP
jgi:hypothetical protein